MSLTLIPRMSYHRDADVMVPMLQNVNELPDVEDTVPVTLQSARTSWRAKHCCKIKCGILGRKSRKWWSEQKKE